MCHSVNVFRLVYIEVILFTDSLKCLYSHWVQFQCSHLTTIFVSETLAQSYYYFPTIQTFCFIFTVGLSVTPHLWNGCGKGKQDLHCKNLTCMLLLREMARMCRDIPRSRLAPSPCCHFHQARTTLLVEPLCNCALFPWTPVNGKMNLFLKLIVFYDYRALFVRSILYHFNTGDKFGRRWTLQVKSI